VSNDELSSEQVMVVAFMPEPGMLSLLGLGMLFGFKQRQRGVNEVMKRYRFDSYFRGEKKR